MMLISQTQNLELNQYIIHEFNHSPIKQRRVDGYFDATAMCKAAGRRWSDYHRRETTRSFINEILPVVQICTTAQNQEIIKTIQGGHPHEQGTWIHPYLAINLAQWCSPQFAVQVTKWVFTLLTTGSVHLNPNNNNPSSQLDYEKLAKKSKSIRQLYQNVGLRGKALDHKVNEVIQSETGINLLGNTSESVLTPENTLTPERQAIIDCIKNGIIHYADIAAALGKTTNAIRKTLSKMKSAGQVISLSKGKYGLVYQLN